MAGIEADTEAGVRPSRSTSWAMLLDPDPAHPVPPVLTEFLIRAALVSSTSLEHLLDRGRSPIEARVETGRCDPTWKTTCVAPMAQAVHRRSQRRDGLGMDLVVRAREVAEVDRMDDPHPRRPRALLGTSTSGSWFGRHARGLWTKS